MRRTLSLLGLLLLAPSLAMAQKKWTQIGATSSGNPVFVDLKSVKKTGNLVAAPVRVVFLKPVATPKGDWMSVRVVGTYDCAKKAIAVKEQTYYGDKAEAKIVDHKVNKLPGYGPALGGSLAGVALDYLCKAK